MTEKDCCDLCGSYDVSYMFECPDRFYCEECYTEIKEEDF